MRSLRNTSTVFTLILLTMTMLMWACGEDDDPVIEPPSVEELRLREGYLVVGNLDGSTFVQYFENLPSGSVDLTQGTDFQNFGAASVIGSTIYTSATDGSNGIQKIIVNETGDFQVVGEITTVGAASGLSVRDSLFGVFHDQNDANSFTTFNPTTMEVTGSVDMSLAFDIVEEGAPVFYGGFAFRGDNEIIVTLTSSEILTGMPRAIVDIASMRATSITSFEGANLENPPIVVTDNHFDESGNYYGPHFSSQGIPTISGGILKIPAGQTTYDQTYHFQVPLQNNPQALALGGAFLTNFEYHENGKGFATINASLDPRIIEIIFVENGGDFGNVDQNELDEILSLLVSSETAIIVEIDMVTQAITKVEGLPTFGPFAQSSITKIDNQIHFLIRSSSANALYRYNGGRAELVFEGTGANIGTVIDLAQDFQ